MPAKPIKKEEITQELLHRFFEYDSINGGFIWKIARGPKKKPGNIAGCLDHAGYMRVSISGIKYAVHRLVWLYHKGYLPSDYIDHINCIKSDNRIENLREADHSKNMQNKQKAHKNNLSGFQGVSLTKYGKYQARIKVNKKEIYLGQFLTAEEANFAYKLAKEKYHNL